MDIRVSGHQVDTGEALRSHVADRLSAIADKYFSRAVAANVTFGRGPHEHFTCDIVAQVNAGRGPQGVEPRQRRAHRVRRRGRQDREAAEALHGPAARPSRRGRRRRRSSQDAGLHRVRRAGRRG